MTCPAKKAENRLLDRREWLVQRLEAREHDAYQHLPIVPCCWRWGWLLGGQERKLGGWRLMLKALE